MRGRSLCALDGGGQSMTGFTAVRMEFPRIGRAVGALAMAAILAGGCAGPGTVATSPPAASATAGASTAGGASTAPTGSATAAGPSCGTNPVVLNAYFETGFDLPF